MVRKTDSKSKRELVMKKFSNEVVGLCQGDVVLFSDFETDGEMWTGEGPRQIRRHMLFDEPFKAPPIVHVTLTMWDMSNAANGCADVMAEDVTAEGFSIVFRTWGDSQVARVRVGWMAIGPARDDEMWEL